VRAIHHFIEDSDVGKALASLFAILGPITGGLSAGASIGSGLAEAGLGAAEAGAAGLSGLGEVAGGFSGALGEGLGGAALSGLESGLDWGALGAGLSAGGDFVGSADQGLVAGGAGGGGFGGGPHYMGSPDFLPASTPDITLSPDIGLVPGAAGGPGGAGGGGFGLPSFNDVTDAVRLGKTGLDLADRVMGGRQTPMSPMPAAMTPQGPPTELPAAMASMQPGQDPNRLALQALRAKLDSPGGGGLADLNAQTGGGMSPWFVAQMMAPGQEGNMDVLQMIRQAMGR
jgi:hypothetical protein